MRFWLSIHTSVYFGERLFQYCSTWWMGALAFMPTPHLVNLGGNFEHFGGNFEHLGVTLNTSRERFPTVDYRTQSLIAAQLGWHSLHITRGFSRNPVLG